MSQGNVVAQRSRGLVGLEPLATLRCSATTYNDIGARGVVGVTI